MKFRENSFDCLWMLFEQASNIGIEFANVQLDISSNGDLFIPQRRFPSSNETEKIKIQFDQISSHRKTMIIIDRSMNNSIVLFQQGQISSNVTVIFHRQVCGKFSSWFTLRSIICFVLVKRSTLSMSCLSTWKSFIDVRVKSAILFVLLRSSFFSSRSSNNFFACQFHCGNETHVICQCPYYSPLMQYVLHHDVKRKKNVSFFSI